MVVRRVGALSVALCLLPGLALSALRVRRELRSLSPESRGRVFAALNVLKATSSAEGVRRFGPRFVGYDEIVAQHLAAASSLQCDQAHLGPAFGTFHRALTLRFEEALLAVDPAIEALPYWDYNVEAIAGDPRASELWAWFGSSEGDASDGNAVKDGLFAHWRIRANASDISQHTNPHGLLRSPWNTNPSPFVTRHRFSCGSETHFRLGTWDTCLRSPDYLAWYACIDPTVHAWAHSFLGGIWDTERNVSRLECYATNSVGIPRAWGNGCLDCPATCSALTSGNSSLTARCRCTMSSKLSCSADRLLLAREAPTYGDFADAWTSPNDPIFFFHHANLDRHLMTWQQRRGVGPDYGFPRLAVPCAGHGLDDIVAPGAAQFDSPLLGFPVEHGALTNKDLIQADGWSARSVYTYDSLDESSAGTSFVQMAWESMVSNFGLPPGPELASSVLIWGTILMLVWVLGRTPCTPSKNPRVDAEDEP